jgi:RHS repeat-associated protein
VVAITNNAVTVVERLAYDPWGKRRQVNGTADTLDAITGQYIDRGFTMHEHIDEMGIINMNGRIYDPLIGRFMSADPYIQAPDDLQSHNRYAYVMNNPLNLTDPSGFSWLSKTWKKAWHSPIFKAALGIVVAFVAPYALAWIAPTLFGAGSLATALATGALSGFASTGTLKGALTGAFTAGIMFGAGSLAETLKLADGSIGKIALHAGAGCVSSVAGGGSCKAGAISGGLGEFGHNIGTGGNTALGTIKAAMLGGIGSKLAGGKFEDGATTGAFGYMFNFLMHAHQDAIGNRTYGIDLAADPQSGYAQDEKGSTIVGRTIGRVWKPFAEFISGLDGQGYGTRDLIGGSDVKQEAYKMDRRMAEIMSTSGVEQTRSGITANMNESQMNDMLVKFATDPQIGKQFRTTYLNGSKSTDALMKIVNERAGGHGLRP